MHGAIRITSLLHYFITAGLRAFDPATSKAVMRKQIARHVQSDPMRLSFLQRVVPGYLIEIIVVGVWRSNAKRHRENSRAPKA